MACAECFSGVVRDDEKPTGTFTTVHGLRTYVAEPASGTASKGIIVIVPDAFGIDFINNQLLADNYAKNGGYKVYLSDFMSGKAAPVWTVDMFRGATVLPWYQKPYYIFWAASSMIPFLIRHRPGVSAPIVRTFLTKLRTQTDESQTFLGAAGFCWGGNHLVLLGNATENSYKSTKLGGASKPLIDAGFVAHPSNVSIPGEIEAMSGVPMSFAIGELDGLCGPKEAESIRGLLAEQETKSEVRIYEGMAHGFAVRADQRLKDVGRAAADAEKQCLDWFDAHRKE